MQYLKDSIFYNQAIHELNYPFGNFYLFDGFVVGEFKEDTVVTWADHAKLLVEDLTNLYDHDGGNVVYITNRVHSYAVKPSDWIKFYRSDYKMRGYAIISYTKKGILNALIEKLFIKSRFRSFESLGDAITWAKSLTKSPVSK
ncbi:hypothetical protein SAMN04487910_0381 [Aquimarina amphilecti]|uniref:SpoIIAA-like n=1 Tax=Aquimarina amphilecti TaxID=1038014 RepID=A0A1H7GI44_AQUAM|nr:MULTISPECIES: hypothetical protein [Aquimarina]AXT55404.1 hypothetical protein D1815_06395 [Aquimarina sp. AD1]MBQ4802374.1 hypothetical protein [Aquimarina sp. MMG015]RKN23237.1 hypothetical protein D7035_11540 [Aquimarina sp. AD1]SEK37714.1 hypothetical protein SAMN04487910_0381 [Aquimarina amphilecti]